MKGFTHFMVGLMSGTFLQKAVSLTFDEKSLILLLGGVYGLLPDTLDFKFAQFFEKFDKEFDIDPVNLNLKEIAEGLADAIDKAWKGNPQNVKLHTLRLGFDHWQEYSVKFDRENKEVIVKLGPVVSTSGAPIGEIPEGIEARAKFEAELSEDIYEEETKINIFNGPTLLFQRVKDKVEVIFIPWHRKWSHSFTVGFLLSLPLLFISKLHFLVAFLGFSSHILADMLGHMGANLFYPFTKKRFKGLKLGRSNDPFLNFGLCYISAIFILYNLNRFTLNLQIFSGFKFLLIFLGIPLLILLTLGMIFRRKGTEAEERKEESEEVPT